MRFLVIFLSVMIVFLMGNILSYLLVPPYKIFLKELKYGSASQENIDDSYNYQKAMRQEVIEKSSDSGEEDTGDIGTNIPTNAIVGSQKKSDDTLKGLSNESQLFLKTLSGERNTQSVTIQLPEISQSEQEILDTFGLLVGKKIDTGGSLFGITTEYPDPYHTWVATEMTTHLFSTRTYEEVLQIFTVLQDELPFEINEINNFAEKSFYINLEESYQDGYIRLIVQIQKSVFGLKIQKDSYNTVKTVLNDNF